MTDSPIAGMLGVEDFVSNSRPENWRAGLFRQEPSGTAPITALTALMGDRVVDDEKYHWWRKDLPVMRATVTGIYTNAGLTTPYTSGGVANDTVYVKMAAAELDNFKPGHEVLLRYSDDASVDCVGIITGEPITNGSSSFVPVMLLEADDNSVTTPQHNLSDVDYIQIIGTAYEDGSVHPKSIAYTESEVWNYCQIFRDSLNLTGRRRATNTRTVDPYDEAKLDCINMHTMGMERAFIWGERSRTTDRSANGQPRTTMRGLVRQVQEAEPDNVAYFDLDATADYAGKTWLEAGADWLEEKMEQSFRYKGSNGVGSSASKLVYCGSQALLGIQKLVRNKGTYTIESGEIDFGIKVTKLISAWGVWNLQTHPLFSYDPVTTYQMLVLEPVDLTYVYLKGRDTQFLPQGDKRWGLFGYDGVLEGYFTDCSIELHYPTQHMYLGGIGKDNTIAL